MCHAVLGDFLKDDKIRKMAAQMRVAMMPKSEVRAALHIQYAWEEILRRQRRRPTTRCMR